MSHCTHQLLTTESVNEGSIDRFLILKLREKDARFGFGNILAVVVARNEGDTGVCPVGHDP